MVPFNSAPFAKGWRRDGASVGMDASVDSGWFATARCHWMHVRECARARACHACV